MITVKYLKALKAWHATYVDELGQLGQGFSAKKRDDAVFALGMQMGRNPQRYSRTVGEYLSNQK